MSKPPDWLIDRDSGLFQFDDVEEWWLKTHIILDSWNPDIDDQVGICFWWGDYRFNDDLRHATGIHGAFRDPDKVQQLGERLLVYAEMMRRGRSPDHQ